MSYYDFDHSILDIANDFYEAYKRCAEGKNPHVDEYGRHVAETPAVPTIVNGIFACELYLKSMLPNIDWKGNRFAHNLRYLYRRLPAEAKKRLRVAIEPNLDWQNKSFDECLKLISNGFQFWRYIHESEDFGELGLNGTLRVLPAFLESLREHALSFHNEA